MEMFSKHLFLRSERGALIPLTFVLFANIILMATEGFYPSQQSLTAVADGAFGYLNDGLVTLVLLPVMAVILYRMGNRLAGQSLGVFALGLFLARMLGAYAREPFPQESGLAWLIFGG